MKKQNKKKNKKKQTTQSKVEWNFVDEAGPGCHIARSTIPATSSWVLEWESIDINDFDDVAEIPDIAVDPEEQELVLCNVRDESVVAYITVYDRVLRGRGGRLLQAGSTTNEEGKSRSCTTLIVLCPPYTFCHLCCIEFPPGSELEDLPLESDVQVWNQHPDPTDEHNRSVGFPLQGGPFLCTQGEAGQLTHFFSGNLHAIDFRCPIGTPLLAVGDGIVVEAKHEHTLTGVAVSNLFQWNSIIIELDKQAENDEPLFVEYVHIASATVKPGDRVTAGQIIGTSGSVGFSPEPHLHFAAYRSSEPTAPTVRVKFQSSRGKKDTFWPKAGSYYDESGKVEVLSSV